MKKNKLVLIFLSFIIISCKKEQNIPIISTNYSAPIYVDKTIFLPGNTEKGITIAQKNGLDWRASAEGLIYIPIDEVRLSVASYTFNKENSQREALNFSNIPLALGKYKLYANNTNQISLGFHRLAGDGDVIADLPRLIIDTTVNTNYFELITVDTITKTMEARFDVSLISRKDAKYEDEKMRFEKGYIKTKLSYF